jgi:hypothetical protein
MSERRKVEGEEEGVKEEGHLKCRKSLHEEVDSVIWQIV